MYGSRVFVRIPEERRKSKWDKKAETGILLGYTDTGYRVLINNRVIVVRHCDIVEEDVTIVNYCDAMSPENFQEAMNCDDANEWKAAMDREMNSLVENKTWTLVDKPTKDKK
ncbi:hypothetical protein EVAR_96788_1 [Eumeta japonica]|uniref:Retroviral polymerase SH3-like domain-containing protein n=1 Tax=Eumeta variegata TaxID=151549 RepID=A0A4C1WRH9_EUMVA|nr:hypothetical protein EVAR_96788_1 [Eumeta japonica]